MNVIEKDTRATSASNLRDDAHHHQTEVLAAAALSGGIGTLLFRAKWGGDASTIPARRERWLDEQRAAFESQVVPTPGRLYWQLLLGIATKVNFRNATRVPLLITAATRDRAVDASTIRWRAFRRCWAIYPAAPALAAASGLWWRSTRCSAGSRT